MLRIYQSEGIGNRADTAKNRQIVTRYIYLPTAFIFTAPFAILAFGPAHLLWMGLTAGLFLLASFLMWDLGAAYAPVISGGLLCCFLSGSELLLISGNAAGIVVSLCIVAVWCFLKERFVPAGVLCLAISLALKPQDTGLVWLYFLLAGGSYRKRALQTVAVVAALSLPAVLWVSQVAPDWTREMRSNLSALSAHGGISDPGPASIGAHGLAMITDLQAVISVFWDDPRIYNPVSYLICGALLAVWSFKALRSGSSPRMTWLALAGVAALSMLPVYHRQYDAKLLLLAVPACAMLWAEGGRTKWLAFALGTAGVVLLGDFPWAILIGLINSFPLPTKGLAGRLLTDLQIFPVPLTLLITAVFYLWLYVRRAPNRSGSEAIS